jgi:hypothetical protein
MLAIIISESHFSWIKKSNKKVVKLNSSVCSFGFEILLSYVHTQPFGFWWRIFVFGRAYMCMHLIYELKHNCIFSVVVINIFSDRASKSRQQRIACISSCFSWHIGNKCSLTFIQLLLSIFVLFFDMINLSASTSSANISQLSFRGQIGNLQFSLSISFSFPIHLLQDNATY